MAPLARPLPPDLERCRWMALSYHTIRVLYCINTGIDDINIKTLSATRMIDTNFT